MLKNIIFVVLFWDLCTGAPIGNVTSEGLYSSEDDVLILTSNNFKQQLYGHNRSMVLEFYSSWCGFCQRYAPFWKAFTHDIQNWQDLIAMGVMDCTNELNLPICSEFAVTRYPTLRYFHPNYQEGRYGVDIKSSSDPVEILKTIASRLVQEQTEGRGSIFPNLQPFVLADVSKIFEASPKSKKYGILILQDASEYIGAQLIMDFHTVEDIVIQYAFLNNTDLIKTLNLPIENSLLLIERGNNTPEILSSGSLDRIVLKELISRALLRKNITIEINNNTDNGVTKITNNTNSQLLTADMSQDDDTVYQVDLESALRYSIKREIGGLKEITAEYTEPAKKYVTILLQYFPFGKGGKALLKDISEYISTTETPNGATIRKMIMQADKADQNVFSSSQGWIRCKGSSPEYRGYPCSMWTLFHYLTVNAAIDNEGQSNFDNSVLEAMYHYIKNFFGCRDCSEHFINRAHDKGLFNVTSYDDAILWLWKVHNSVNKDLAGDSTEDPQHPKVQFPSKMNCAQCYITDGSWNNDEVLNYLKKIYSRRHISYTGSNVSVLDIPAKFLTGAAPLKSRSNTIILMLTGAVIWRHLY